MKSFLRKNIFFLFWAIVILDIIGVIANIPALHFIFKALLMPVLILAVLLLAVAVPGNKKITAALFFSFLGDVLLLFQDRNQLFFILGLSCFLITHIFYISYFIQLSNREASIIKQYPYLGLLIILYTGSLLYLLLPKLGDLRIPVIIYACIISVMLYCSLRLPYSIGKMSMRLLIGGAFCFIVSDSLLAIDKFYKHFSSAPALIMLTYCTAQFFIVKGFIKTANK